MRRLLVILLLFASAHAISLDYSSTTTAPPTLEDKGYLYITFCSRANELETFDFTAQGFTATPGDLSLDFGGTSTTPDCKQAVLLVTSDDPGMFTLVADAGSQEWVIPVEFSKPEPLEIRLTQSAVYTGYDEVGLRVGGRGEDAWLTVGSQVVGNNRLYSAGLPATFPVTFHFSEPGFYDVPVLLTYDRNNRTVVQNYTLGVRVETPPVRILRDLRVPSDGYANLTLPLVLPETIYGGTVSLTSECLEGSTSQYVENFRQGNLTFQVKGVCDPGIYEMGVEAGNFQTTVPLRMYGPEGYELFLNTDQRDGEHRLDVVIANEGSQTMKSVSVRLLDGNYRMVREGSFIGDLEFGDFDSVELAFVPQGNPVDVNYRISYTLGGERLEDTRAFSYEFPRQSGGWLNWLLLLAAIAGGYWYVKHRRAGS